MMMHGLAKPKLQSLFVKVLSTASNKQHNVQTHSKGQYTTHTRLDVKQKATQVPKNI
jgi:hypothetical protein